MEKILIVDLSYVFHRYWYVNDGQGYKDPGIYGTCYFLNLIARNNLEEFGKIYIVLDSDLKNHEKKKLYPEYKSGRGDKKETVYKNWGDFLKILSSFNSKFIILRNKFHEADEVIAALAVKESRKGKEATIHSGDKDLIQLCGFPNISLSNNYRGGKFITLSKKDLNKKFKVGKDNDYSFISEDLKTSVLWKTFKGDISDNIKPAIPKINYKDVKAIIQKWNGKYLDEGNLADNIICNLTDMSLKHKIAENFDTILLNYKLVSLLDCWKDKSILSNTKMLLSTISKEELTQLCQFYKVNLSLIGV